jgi:hypothetical protein
MRHVLVTAAVLLALPAGALAMTKPEAVDLANAVNLQSADLPGYDVTPPDITGSQGDSLAKCAGSVPHRLLVADISSANFDTGAGPAFRDVSSDIEVFPSEALATKDFNAIKSKRARRCVVKQGKNQRLSGVGRVISVKLKLLKPQVAGAFGYRITFRVRHGFGSIPIVLDALAIHQGPVEASLAVASGAKGTLPRSRTDRLLGLHQTRLGTARPPPAGG